MDEQLIRAYHLEGEVALVTGASSGLGRRFALTLARAGARVAIAARRIARLEELAAEIEGFDGRALPIELDVTDPENVRQAVAAAETELGPVTILINNSGISIEKRVADFDEADYDRIMDTNAKGAFFVAQERLYEHVFSVGDTIDPADGFRAFRGRDVDTRALLRKRGFPVD